MSSYSGYRGVISPPCAQHNEFSVGEPNQLRYFVLCVTILEDLKVRSPNEHGEFGLYTCY